MLTIGHLVNLATLEWAYWLAQMSKVSIVAYLVGGAFLNLAYWDVPYYLFVCIAVTRWALNKETLKTAVDPRALPNIVIQQAPSQALTHGSSLPQTAGSGR